MVFDIYKTRFSSKTVPSSSFNIAGIKGINYVDIKKSFAVIADFLLFVVQILDFSTLNCSLKYFIATRNYTGLIEIHLEENLSQNIFTISGKLSPKWQLLRN